MFAIDKLGIKLDGAGQSHLNSSTAWFSAEPSKQDLIEFHKARNLTNYHNSMRHSSVDRAKQTRKKKVKVNGNDAIMIIEPMNPDSRFFVHKKRKKEDEYKAKLENILIAPKPRRNPKSRSIREQHGYKTQSATSTS
jgi:UPF0288 family protein (methanogenesis marker protein 3)